MLILLIWLIRSIMNYVLNRVNQVSLVLNLQWVGVESLHSILKQIMNYHHLVKMPICYLLDK